MTVVGWVGIFLGHTIPSTKINNATNAEFDQFLSDFSLQRPRIFELIDRHWSEAPRLIKMIGCTSLLLLFANLGVPGAELPKLLCLSSPLSSSGAEIVGDDEKKQDDKNADMGAEMVTDAEQMSSDSKTKEEFLPGWKWYGMSCSLDAVLLLSLRVYHELPAKCQALSPDHVEPVYEAWRNAVQQWQSKGEWKSYNGAVMHEKRDSIRALLQDGGLKNGKSVTISQYTSDFDILSIFIPPSLTTFQIKTQFKCRSPVHADDPDFEFEAYKTRTLKHLSIQGIWAKNSSTQQVLDRSVMSHVAIIV
jgi:hypothetical protein